MIEVNKDYKQDLEFLRKQIPVGLTHGLKLLDAANGNLDRAIEIFKQETLFLIINKTGVAEALASKYLTKHNFDVHATLLSIDDECFTLTEKIINRCHDKEECLQEIVSAIEQHYSLQRTYWLKLDCLELQDPELFCLVAVGEWLLYESYERFDTALYFYLDVVIHQIESQLLLPEIAHTLKLSKKIYVSQFEQQQGKLRRTGVVEPTHEFKEQDIMFATQKPVLVEALYNYAKKHIKKLP